MGGRRELGEERGNRSAAKGGGVEGVDEDVNWKRDRGGVEMGEDGLKEFARLRRKGREGVRVDERGEGEEDLTQGDGRDVAIDDGDWGWVWEGVQVCGKRSEEVPFGAVAVEADVEALGEFESPLGE